LKEVPKGFFILMADSMNKTIEDKIWYARIATYTIAFIEIFTAVIRFIMKDIDKEADINSIYSLILSLAIAGIFIVLAVWSKEKPYPAFLTIIIFYLAFIVFDILVNPFNIFRSVIVRIAIITILIIGTTAAQELKNKKDQ
jgi:hypothetical protein